MSRGAFGAIVYEGKTAKLSVAAMENHIFLILASFFFFSAKLLGWPSRSMACQQLPASDPAWEPVGRSVGQSVGLPINLPDTYFCVGYLFEGAVPRISVRIIL